MRFDPEQHAKEVAQQRVMDRITQVAQWTMMVGAVLGLLGLAYLLYAVFSGSLDSAQAYTQADRDRIAGNVVMAGRFAIFGFALMLLGLSWIYLTEAWLGYVLLLLAAAFYWGVPTLIAQIRNEPQPGTLAQLGINQFRYVAWLLMPPGVLLAVYTAISRGFRRLRYGATLDQELGLGGTVSKQNTMQKFLGKCWQLAYCRDYIRQRCPIFHARRTCWRERVGCMCDEKAIALALKDKSPSANPEQNVKFIPYTKDLSQAELRERCYHCVIYNEHQRQKYQLLAPLTAASVIAFAYFFNDALRDAMLKLITTIDKAMSQFSLSPAHASDRVLEATFKANETATLILYISLVIISLSYALRLVETAVFKWKI